MFISNEDEYQQALLRAHQLQSPQTPASTTEEKIELNNLLKAINSYQFRMDPVAPASAIP